MYGTRPSPWQTGQLGRPVFLVPLAAIHAAHAGQVRQASRGKRTGSSVSISAFFIVSSLFNEFIHFFIKIYWRLICTCLFLNLLMKQV